ncbi:uncharacterized protein LOC116011439 [Ipomoea triloba]|uniref:uncharacterized protein LOC116011439 n=1 Tax=Ipomoea triloba TaxID=35885 RepID=UPI00125CFAF0|nr:uncharacterized protein LOC116011439 [Ipomoea triloba]
MKRPSPSFPSSLQEPSPKRLSLLPPSPSPLYRSLSEPIDSLGILNVQTADNSKISPPPPILSEPSSVKNSESRNRMPIPPLHRSLSDPTAAALEFRPSPPQTIKSPAQESPNTKRVKRMKDRLRQMREWWDQVLQEEDEKMREWCVRGLPWIPAHKRRKEKKKREQMTIMPSLNGNQKGVTIFRPNLASDLAGKTKFVKKSIVKGSIRYF